MCYVVFQLIALGALGVHGHHVQRHVAGAHRAVQEPKMDHIMADKNAQDPQVLPDHATLIAAQHVSKMDGNAKDACVNCDIVSKLYTYSTIVKIHLSISRLLFFNAQVI